MASQVENEISLMLQDQRSNNDNRREEVKPRALYPRADFHRLAFPETVGPHERARWRNRFQNELTDNVGMPRKEKWYFKYIYVERRCQNIIKGLQEGFYGGIYFLSEDNFDEAYGTRRRYGEYILRGYPPNDDPNDAIKLFGDKQNHIHKVSRIMHKGRKTPSIKIVWKNNSEEPPKEMPLFSDVNDPPIITVEKMRPPQCYNCHDEGHIKKYCPKLNCDAYNETNESQMDPNSLPDQSLSSDAQIPYTGNISDRFRNQIHRRTYAKVANPSKSDNSSNPSKGDDSSSETSLHQQLLGKVDVLLDTLADMSEDNKTKNDQIEHLQKDNEIKNKQIEKLLNELTEERKEKEKDRQQMTKIMKKMSNVENLLKARQDVKKNCIRSYDSCIAIEEGSDNDMDGVSDNEAEVDKETEGRNNIPLQSTNEGKQESINVTEKTEESTAMDQQDQMNNSDELEERDNHSNEEGDSEEQEAVNEAEGSNNVYLIVKNEGKGKTEQSVAMENQVQIDNSDESLPLMTGTDSVAYSLSEKVNRVTDPHNSPQLGERLRSSSRK